MSTAFVRRSNRHFCPITPCAPSTSHPSAFQNAFAGRDVVKQVDYVEIGGANRIMYEDAPLPTTLTTFKVH